MFWRPSTEPPRLSRWLLAALTSRANRRYLLDDLQDEFEERVGRDGREAACRFYRRQARESVGPLLATLLRSLVHRRPGADPGVGVRWRPRVTVHHQPSLHGAPMRDLFSDLRLAVRTCLQRPMPTIVIVLSLGLGIGGTTAIYSFSRALLFGAEPLPDVVRVYTAAASDPTKAFGNVSAPDYLDVRSDVGSFEATAMFRVGGVEMNTGGARRRLLVELVADDYFGITRLVPTLGRLPAAEETALRGASPVVVLGYDLWNTEFAADPAIVGRSLRMDGKIFTVVGVGPQGYSSRLMGFRVDAWLPAGIDGGIANIGDGGLENRGERNYGVLARLNDGGTPARARAQLEVLSQRLGREHPEHWVDVDGGVRGFSLLEDDGSRVPPEARAPILALLGLIGLACVLVLLIACSNAAGLALAQGQRRRREMAVRLSMGASRLRLVRMLLIENAVPALTAAALGVVVARGLTGLLRQPALPIDVPLGWQVAQDGGVLLFALSLGLVSTLLLGLAPALEGARTDLVTSLKGDASGGSGRGMWLRRVLIVGQVSLAVVFVVVASVMMGSAGRLDTSNLGFDADRLAVMSRGLVQGELAGEGKLEALEALRQQLLARPEIDGAEYSVSAESTLLAGEFDLKVGLGEREPELVAYNAVSETYLETLGIPLQRGSSLDAYSGRQDVAVVNQSFVRRFESELPAGVIGNRFRLIDPDGGQADVRYMEIIGVAADGAYVNPAQRDEPYFWMPFDAEERFAILTVRGSETADLALQALREESKLGEGEVPLIAARTYRSLVDAQTSAVTTASQWLGGIGVLGMLLALMGIYGLVSYIVSLRGRELAIRQAVGASPQQLVLGVAVGGLRLAAVGFVLGLVPALLLVRNLGELVPGIRALDPVPLVLSAVVVALATLWASAWPARRVASGVPGHELRGR